MGSLVRSSTTVRAPRQRDNSKSSFHSPRGMRLRSSSFTNSSSTTTTSQPNITNGLFPTATTSSSCLQPQPMKHRHGRRHGQPSFESSTTPTYTSAGQNLQTFNTDHSSNTTVTTTATTTGSLLTVDGDIHPSTIASSVETLSDDDDDDDIDVDDVSCSPSPFSPPLQQQSKLAALAPPPPPSRAIPPIPQSPNSSLHAPVPKASVSRSISNAFKDKLTLSRKKSKFSLRKNHGNASSPILYDDGSQATYPPRPQKNNYQQSTER